jgi:glutamate/tyrosine decarboxylase-like PLP-dependent enzyme
MNAHDSERIKGMLEELGLGETQEQEDADVLVFNTCTIREKPDQRFAAELTSSDRAEVVNDVVFNQVLVRWLPPDGRDPDAFNDAVVAAVQAEGTAYVSGTTWRGDRLMRISVSDWATDEHDVDRTTAAMLRCHAAVATAA